jgi:hypothetical protein
MSASIRQYIRNSKGNPRGVILAIKRPDGTVGFGWSLCNRKDSYNKDFGYGIALRRATEGSNAALPRPVEKLKADFFDRAGKYFRVPVTA